MTTRPANEVIRQQLVRLRQDAVEARLNINRAMDVPAGFGTDVVQLFTIVGGLNFPSSARCKEYALSITGRPTAPWEIADVDRIIDRINDMLKEIESQEVQARQL